MRQLLAVLLLVGSTVSSFAAGLIIVHDEEFWRGYPPLIVPPPPPWPEPRPPRPAPPERRIVPPRPPRPVYLPLELSFTKADVRIVEQLATTKVEQEFYNPNTRRLEGTFLFPVPRGAHVDKFTMEINGKPVEAELLAADKARDIYEEIVRRTKDPALLEYAGRDLFKVRIFPIEPQERKKITLSYAQILKAEAGLVGLILPLNTEKFSAKPLRNVSVKVDLQAKHALKAIYSPSHKVEVKRSGANRATIGFEGTDLKSDTDFQLFYTQAESDLGMSLLTYKRPGEEGYFLLLASPGAETKRSKVIPKDVVFVLDTSGSMAGAKLEQAKKALAFCVENLNDDDRFELLRFATEVEPLFDKLRDASKEARATALQFIEGLKPIGGTAINDALKKAVSLRPGSGTRPFVVVFLTDGRPTVGEIDEEQIIKTATKTATGLTRIFSFGIGSDVNTHLLDKVAEETKAFSQYVLAEEDLEVKVSSFFTKIKEPVLANPKLTFPEGVRATKIYPAPIPDVFKGEQLIIAGRYADKGSGAVQISGEVNGEVRPFAYDASFPDESREHDFIPRLWATRRVGYLLDEIRLRGESKELREEVTELARTHGIVTPYTAYLIIEDEQRRAVPLSLRSVQQPREPGGGPDYGAVYYRAQTMKEGGGAVADARSLAALKTADASAPAIASGNVEAMRETPSSGPPAAAGIGGSVALRNGVPTRRGLSIIADPQPAGAAPHLEQQSRFVAGKTFFSNSNRWVEVELQKKTQTRRVRLEFGSEDYFRLAREHPEARPWLALGKAVEFVLGDIVYEVVESSP